jgi:large subunit ribosomal protein L13e
VSRLGSINLVARSPAALHEPLKLQRTEPGEFKYTQKLCTFAHGPLARPLELLRPAVRCPTVKYNIRVRAGRGFTFEELKAAGVPRKEALSIGIPVDHRRRNRSEESLARNVERLKAYKAKLILFPLKSKKPKKGDSQVRLTRSTGYYKLKRLQGDDLKAERATNPQVAFPIVQETVVEAPRKITDEEREFNAYSTVRLARIDQRQAGKRDKRRKAKEAEEAAKTK